MISGKVVVACISAFSMGILVGHLCGKGLSSQKGGESSDDEEELDMARKEHRRLQRINTADFESTISDQDIYDQLHGCINDSLSPSDNAASLLHLMIGDNLKPTSRAALAYAIQALKTADGVNALPAALHVARTPSIMSLSSSRSTTQADMTLKRRSSEFYPTVLIPHSEEAFEALSTQRIYSWLRSEYSTCRRENEQQGIMSPDVLRRTVSSITPVRNHKVPQCDHGMCLHLHPARLWTFIPSFIVHALSHAHAHTLTFILVLKDERYFVSRCTSLRGPRPVEIDGIM
jgi:hypothetical protein